MIELLLINLFFQVHGIFITNVSGNTLPWNTSLNITHGNLTEVPNYVIINIPWFFPLITLVLMLMTDYVLGIKRGVDSKVNFFAVALVYTMLTYIEVAGSLTTSGFFYLFDFIMILSVFVMTLFNSNLA